MIPVPKGLQYLPFQEEAIEFARNRDFTLIADDMGIGKTIEAIGFLNCHPEIETLLVVCPLTVKVNWKRELDKWLISPCVDVTIVNYDVLGKLDIKTEWDVVIMDESQYVKNLRARRSRLCRLIKAKYRLLLTGTPILNRPVELFHQLHILDPVEWPISSYKNFTLRFCNAHMGKWGWDVSGSSHLDELRELLKPLMIRRLKQDVLKDLPAKRRQIVEIEILANCTKDLRARMRDATARVVQAKDTYKDDVRKLNNVLTVEWNEMAALRHELGDAKVRPAVRLLEDSLANEEKVVVFAHHISVIEELQMCLPEYFPAVIHGSIPALRRQKEVDRFQNNKRCRVFIGQIMAAGTGITLTAASHVVFVEMDWVPGIMSQAEDRCHRLGQRNSVLIQHLVLENSLDCYMAKMLVRKQEIVEKVTG